jgi:DNA-binding CsgD family transcriptional regulator
MTTDGIVDSGMASPAALFDALADATDHMRIGLVLASSTSSVLFMNDSARQILAAGDGVVERDGVLQAESPDAAARLDRALACVGRMSARARRQCIDVIAIERRGSNAPLQICVTPLRSSTNAWVAGLFIHDPSRVEPSARLFERIYELTPAEARVAAAFLRDGSAAAAAESLGISMNTVRTHIKELYRKTATRGQAELIRSLASGLGTLHATF